MRSAAPSSMFVTVNGIRLHYLDWGGKGPALLFLAGMGLSTYIFSRFAPRFTDKFHVLALDRRGHGDSDYPESGYDADTLTEDLRLFLRALKIDRVILAGHSMAVVELCHFTALHPQHVLKLVFLDAAYDDSIPEQHAAFGNNPAGKMRPPWPKEEHRSVEEAGSFSGHFAIPLKHFVFLRSTVTCARKHPGRNLFCGREQIC